MRKKAPRRLKTAQNDKPYRDWVKRLPCIVCGVFFPDTDSQPAHMTLGPNEKGHGMKTHDRQVVPMCHLHHSSWDEHRGRFRGMPDERRWAQAATWVAETQLKATPESFEHALDLQRFGLGTIKREPFGVWSWIPGPARSARPGEVAA